MESIGWCDYKVQCSCKACVFQAGLDIGIQILTLGPVFLYLYSVSFYSTSFRKLSLSMWQTKWPPVALNSHPSRLAVTGHIELLSTSVYLLTPSKAVIISSWIICPNLNQPFWLGERGILVIPGHKLNPLHLGSHWWALSPGLNGGAEEFPKQIKEWNWEGIPLNKKV